MMAIRTQPRPESDAPAEAARVAAALEEMRAAFAAIDTLNEAGRALLARLEDHGSAAIPALAKDTGLTAAAARDALAALIASGLASTGQTGDAARPAITNLGSVVLAEIRRRTALASPAPPELAGDLAIAADAVARLKARLDRAA